MQTMICSNCKEEKLLNLFQKDKSIKRGYRKRCKSCANKKVKRYRENFKEKYKVSYVKYNYNKGKDNYYRKRYGLSKIEYERLCKSQLNRCTICGRENGNRPLSVDHCHKTGKIRGLICIKCNSTIGFCDESEKILLNIINYIKDSKCQP